MTARVDALSQMGAAIREVREAHGLSQEDVAERVVRDDDRRQELPRPGSANDLDAIESGRDNPNFLTLVDLARAIDVPLGELLAALDRHLGTGGS
jgi:transcriptional regulator with XRE-family HTH domain